MSECSLPEARPGRRSMSGASLPPGPPSSAAGQSVVEQEVMRSAPLTSGTYFRRRPSLPAAPPLPPPDAGGAPPALPSMQMEPIGPSSTPFRSSIANLAPALNWPAAPPRKPRNRLAYTKTAYLEFCQRTRPLLSNALGNAEREKVLGQQWKALSKAEKAKYKVQGESQTSAPAHIPATASAHTPSAASAATRTVVARTVGTASLEDAHSKAKRPRSAAETGIAPPIPLLSAPTSLALAAPSHPPIAPAPATRPCRSAAHDPSGYGLNVVITTMLEQMTEQEAVEALETTVNAADVPSAPSYTPVSVPVPVPLAPAPAAPHHLAVPRTHLATPTRLPAPTQSANLGLEQLQLAELVEHMSAEEALEVVGEAGLGTALDMLQRPREEEAMEALLETTVNAADVPPAPSAPPVLPADLFQMFD